MSKKAVTEQTIELRVSCDSNEVLGEYPVIWLGRGNTIVSDVAGLHWAGIVVSTSKDPAPVGEDFTGKLDPIIVIASKDPRSLDVIIDKCRIAKEALSDD